MIYPTGTPVLWEKNPGPTVRRMLQPFLRFAFTRKIVEWVWPNPKSRILKLPAIRREGKITYITGGHCFGGGMGTGMEWVGTGETWEVLFGGWSEAELRVAELKTK